MSTFDLSRFPEDVYQQWISVYVNSEGWPPKIGEDGKPTDRWRYLLSGKPVSWWFEGEWEKHKRHLTINELSPGSRNTLTKMALSYLTGSVNEYSASIPDMKERIDYVISHIKTEGTMPFAPVLYQSDDGVSISDGNHRLCAYYICYGYFNIPVPKELELLPEHEFEFWLYKNG